MIVRADWSFLRNVTNIDTAFLPSSWHTQYSWKLLHPTNEYDNKECPKDAEAYERVRHT